MKYKARLLRFPPTGNHYLEVMDKSGNEITSIKVIKEGALCEELLIDSLMESVDDIFKVLKKPNPFTTLYQSADDQRLSAINDIHSLFVWLNRKFDITEFGELNEINQRWNKTDGTMLFNTPSRSQKPIHIQLEK